MPHAPNEPTGTPAEPRAGRLGTYCRELGPGLITGAADDDPSGIGTYSQAGAAFGYGLLWTTLLSLPLMIGVQLMCARIGLVSGRGLASVLRKHYPPWLLWLACLLLVGGNTINIAADLGAMGAAAHLLTGIRGLWFVPPFAVLIVVLLTFASYARMTWILKWLALALFAYIGAAVLAHPNWGDVLRGTFVPQITWSGDYLLTVVAILGTTISPYLFFWQAAQEVEHSDALERTLGERPKRAVTRELRTRGADVITGMVVSNVIMYFIILTAGATLHAAGHTDIQTADQAAAALKPLAGPLAAWLFAAGIIATGLLGVPVLAGSAAYAIAEAAAWRRGMDTSPKQARNFYAVIAVAMLLGMALNFARFNAIKLLFWSAVVNGLLAPPLVIIILVVANNRTVMREHRNGRWLNASGVATAVVMSAAAVALVVSWLR